MTVSDFASRGVKDQHFRQIWIITLERFDLE